MDSDGDVDVVMALGMRGVEGTAVPVPHQIAWYEHEGDPTGPWQKHIVCECNPDAFEAIAGDIDCDGETEIIATA